MEINLVHPFTMLQQLSYLMEAKVGGTTGAVYSIFFAAAANVFKVYLFNYVKYCTRISN